MRTALASFLVALAVLTNMLLATPAAAGMVPTPRPDPAEREAALDRAAGSLPGMQARLESLPTSDLLLLAGLPESRLRAANDALVVLLVFVGIIVFVAFFVTIIIIERVRHHRHHFGAELEPAPASPTGG